MEKRTEEQNKRLFKLLKQHGFEGDDEARAKMAKMASVNRTAHTSELTIAECDALLIHLSDTLTRRLDTMRRLRWRLWFAFRDSKYEAFKGDVGRDGKRMPNYKLIDSYCNEQWKTTIAEMSEKELTKYISIVKKW